MLLNELTLIEAANIETHFNQNGLQAGQGSFEIDYGSLSIEAGGSLIADTSKSVLVVHAEPKAFGKRENHESVEFSLSIKMRLIFAYPASYEIDENFLKENSWFFSSQMKIFFKQYAESILRQSGLAGIKLPMN